MLNETHDPKLKSWVESANDPATDFPIQNLPFGVYRGRGESQNWGEVCVAIGDQVVNLNFGIQAGLFRQLPKGAQIACTGINLDFMLRLDPKYRSALRKRLSKLLRADTKEDKRVIKRCLVPMAEVEMLLPVEVGDYTDFYASIHHATNVGSMFRPENPLLPNYKFVPIGYHGRASSIVPSGTPIRRPSGQTKDDAAPAPSFGPCKSLDYELEVGLFVGPGNRLGKPIPIADAENHLFGVCLLNDWSARDIQKWEYQPLGPFLAKNFATTISPWIVTMEALTPYRVPAFARPAGDPAPLPYLLDADDQSHGGIALTLEVWLRTAQMRKRKLPAHRLSRGNFADLYWTPAQLLAHHASNGCNLRPGDLLGSGTVSGSARENRGCLLELTWRGTEPLTLPTGETRRFLGDGDEVILRGYCEREGHPRLGLGECSGIVQPAQ
jgi:fumarylacetoacetase